ncbi:Aerotaxis receptor [Posidoniimonas polymericola]|uniref:Aerotaxis receptor n=1 Tax=Posidoniimonas polymericola TaxID=2528002 RepID=A0A5C5YPP0_9BACT|nr:PAS domain-containing protein [Posidoniimonas polymericola]TWT76932.1 Aerotaxis receptor [Posidoniimonas polymericola]
MSSKNIVPINEERAFEVQELFFSVTDLKGVIRFGNEVFTRISGYDEPDLIGKPHNVIRHPDMPRAVFKLLWDYLESDRPIAAYVKNMAKDGRYYWVLATVMPIPGGYLSIRLKPTSPLFAAVKGVYAEALSLERTVEKETGNRKTAMEAATGLILEKLAAHGFADYDAFMSEALSQELVCREAQLREVGYTAPTRFGAAKNAYGALEEQCCMLASKLTAVFSSTGTFKQLSEELSKKYQAIQELGPSLQFLALNARMAASRLGDQGVVQAAVADALGAKSKQAEGFIHSLIERMTPLQHATNKQVFDIAVARFEADMAHAFAAELKDAPPDSHCLRVRESLTAVTDELAKRCGAVMESMQLLDYETHKAQIDVQELITRIVEMKAIQLNGKIEAAASDAKSDFSVIFEEASRYIEGGRTDCGVLLDVLEVSSDEINSFRQLEPELQSDLRTMCDTTERAVSGGLEAVPA